MKKVYKVYNPSLEMRKRASPTSEMGEPDFWNGRAWFGKRASPIWETGEPDFHMDFLHVFFTRGLRGLHREHVAELVLACVAESFFCQRDDTEFKHDVACCTRDGTAHVNREKYLR